MKIFNFYVTIQVSTLYHALVVAREENGLKRPIIGVNLSIPFVPREVHAVKVTMKGKYLCFGRTYYTFSGVLLTGCESKIGYGNIHILRQQKDWVGESKKCPALMTFSTVFLLVGKKKSKIILK